MSEITALESRITAALDRIRAGVAQMSAAPTPEAAQSSGLQTALDEERMANAQLQERVRTLKERQDGKITELERRVAAQGDQMAALDAEIQRLRASNSDMREINAQLRSAVAEESAAPELINRAMLAEIEALQAQRASEAAEVDAILAELKPLIAEA